MDRTGHAPAGRRRLSGLRKAGLTLAVLAAGGIACGGFAAACRPRWYVPAAVDMRRLEGDKDALARLVDEISAALNGGRAIDFELTDAQLNRWVAARREVWPGEDWLELGPLELPLVRFEEGAVRVAAVVRRGGWGCVVSCSARVSATHDELTARIESVAAGRLPIPRAAAAAGLFRAAFRSAARERMLSDGESLPLRNEFVWPNGKRRFRVQSMTFARGSVRVRLSPA